MSQKTKVIHVNGHLIKKNMVRLKRGMSTLDPPLTSKPKSGGKAQKGNTIAIKYRGVEVARVVYRPMEPLKSGATAWIETEHDVEVVPDPVPVETVGAPPLLEGDLFRMFLRVLVAKHEPELRKMLNEQPVT